MSRPWQSSGAEPLEQHLGLEVQRPEVDFRHSTDRKSPVLSLSRHLLPAFLGHRGGPLPSVGQILDRFCLGTPRGGGAGRMLSRQGSSTAGLAPSVFELLSCQLLARNWHGGSSGSPGVGPCHSSSVSCCDLSRSPLLAPVLFPPWLKEKVITMSHACKGVRLVLLSLGLIRCLTTQKVLKHSFPSEICIWRLQAYAEQTFC